MVSRSAFSAALVFALVAASGCGGADSGSSTAASAPAPADEAPRNAKLLTADDWTWHGRGEQDPLAERLSTYQKIRAEIELTVEDARRAVELEVPGSRTFDALVPERARLVFSTRIAVPELHGRYLPVAWTVAFADETGAEREVWRESTSAVSPDGGGWRDHSVDLEALAGARGRLVFRAEPEARYPDPPPEDVRAVLAAPELVTLSDARPSILVVTIDTLRRDALAPYGGDPALTPELARLAARGVVVEQSWSTASWTLPSYASLFTGEYPSAHGAGRDWSVEWEGGATPTRGVASGAPSLVELLDRSGYATQAFHNNANLRRGSGLERGFDGYVHYGVTGRAGVSAFERWLPTVVDRPFFCVVHLADPHSPYVPPKSYAAPPGTPDPESVPSLSVDAHELREQGVPPEEHEAYRRLYLALVGATDALVGDVLDALERAGRTDDTLVVFHADHGEELWDHGGWFHGHGHHVELVRTPLVFSWPGELMEGARVDGPFRGVDVLPTALDLVGAWSTADAASFEGRSLAPLLRGGSVAPPVPPALSEQLLFGAEDDCAVTLWPWHLIVSGSERRLFDLSADPEERTDLTERFPERAAELERIARELRARAAGRRRGTSARMQVDAAAEQALSALGYGGGEGD